MNKNKRKRERKSDRGFALYTPHTKSLIMLGVATAATVKSRRQKEISIRRVVTRTMSDAIWVRLCLYEIIRDEYYLK